MCIKVYAHNFIYYINLCVCVCVCVYVCIYIYLYLEYINHLYNNLVIRNSDIILKSCKKCENKLPRANKQIHEWPIEYFLKMFNMVSHQGKETKTSIIYHCTCRKMTKRKKKKSRKLIRTVNNSCV